MAPVIFALALAAQTTQIADAAMRSSPGAIPTPTSQSFGFSYTDNGSPSRPFRPLYAKASLTLCLCGFAVPLLELHSGRWHDQGL